MICSKVDLPQPLGPTRVTKRPLATLSEMSSSTLRPPAAAPKLLLTERTTIASVVASTTPRALVPMAPKLKRPVPAERFHASSS